jgi:hypothetical protein
LTDDDSPAHVLIVAHKTAASRSLLDAVRDRAARGPCWFHLLVPLPAPRGWHHEHDAAEGRRVLTAALPLLEEAAHRPVDGSVSARHDPMEAIEEALVADEFDEIILSTLPRSISRWLHVDLPHRVAHLGLPLTTVIADERDAATLD